MNLFKKRSLSFKLVLLFLLTGVAMIVALRFASGNSFVKHFENSLRPHLHQYFLYIKEEIGTPPNLETANRLSDSLNVRIIIQGPEINWSSDDTFPNQRHLHFKSHKDAKGTYESGWNRKNFAVRFSNAPYTTTFITLTDSGPPPIGKLLFSLLLVLSLLYLMLRWMISPIKDIQKSVKKIGSGELSHRIPVRRQDELGELSSEINAMADDVENMLEAKRQLLLAISHELRSPITRAKVALSLMDDEHLKQGLENDMNEMEAMISGLLEAEKLNHRHQTLNFEKKNINDLVRNTIETFYPDENIKQDLQDSNPEFLLDEARIQFAVKNLINNALKHRKQANDEITVSTHSDETYSTLIVEDQGKGVSEEHLPHLKEPFYRADPSRHRDTGGYGLGLYIIDKIVNAHQGELTIESTENVGTKVIIKIPFMKI